MIYARIKKKYYVKVITLAAIGIFLFSDIAHPLSAPSRINPPGVPGRAKESEASGVGSSSGGGNVEDFAASFRDRFATRCEDTLTATLRGLGVSEEGIQDELGRMPHRESRELSLAAKIENYKQRFKYAVLERCLLNEGSQEVRLAAAEILDRPHYDNAMHSIASSLYMCGMKNRYLKSMQSVAFNLCVCVIGDDIIEHYDSEDCDVELGRTFSVVVQAAEDMPLALRFRDAMIIDESKRLKRHVNNSELQERIFELIVFLSEQFMEGNIEGERKAHFIERTASVIHRTIEYVYHNVVNESYRHRLSTNFLYHGHHRFQVAFELLALRINNLASPLTNEQFDALDNDDTVEELVEEALALYKTRDEDQRRIRRILADPGKYLTPQAPPGLSPATPYEPGVSPGTPVEGSQAIPLGPPPEGRKDPSPPSAIPASPSVPAGGGSMSMGMGLHMVPAQVLRLSQEMLMVMEQTTEGLLNFEEETERVLSDRFTDPVAKQRLVSDIGERALAELKETVGSSELDLEDDQREEMETMLGNFVENMESDCRARARGRLEYVATPGDERTRMLDEIYTYNRVCTPAGNIWFESKQNQIILTPDTMYLLRQFSIAALISALGEGESKIPQDELERIMEEDRSHFVTQAEELLRECLNKPRVEHSYVNPRIHIGGYRFRFLGSLEKSLCELVDKAKALRRWPADFSSKRQAYLALYDGVVEVTGMLSAEIDQSVLNKLDTTAVSVFYKHVRDISSLSGNTFLVGPVMGDVDDSCIIRFVLLEPPEELYAQGRDDKIVVANGFSTELMAREGIQTYATSYEADLSNTEIERLAESRTIAEGYLYVMGGEKRAVVTRTPLGLDDDKEARIKESLNTVSISDNEIEFREEEGEERAPQPVPLAVDFDKAARYELEETTVARFVALADRSFYRRDQAMTAYCIQQLSEHRESARIYVVRNLPFLIEEMSILRGADLYKREYAKFLRNIGGDEIIRELRDIAGCVSNPAVRRAQAISTLSYYTDSKVAIQTILSLGLIDHTYLSQVTIEALDRMASSAESMEAMRGELVRIRESLPEEEVFDTKPFLEDKMAGLQSAFEVVCSVKEEAPSKQEIESAAQRISSVISMHEVTTRAVGKEEVDLFGDMSRVAIFLMMRVNIIAARAYGDAYVRDIRRTIFLKPIYAYINSVNMTSEMPVAEKWDIASKYVQPAVYQLLFLTCQSFIEKEELKKCLEDIARRINWEGVDGPQLLPLLIKKYFSGSFVALTEDEKNWLNVTLLETFLGTAESEKSELDEVIQQNMQSRPSLHETQVVVIYPKLVLDFGADFSRLPEDVHAWVKPGRGGCNVSHVLMNTQTPYRYLGYRGGITGGIATNLLEQRGISTADFVTSYESCTVNATIQPQDTGHRVSLKPNAQTISPQEKGLLLRKISDMLDVMKEHKEGNPSYNPVFILTGQLPKGIGKDFYRTVTKKCKEAGFRVIVDAEADELGHAMKAAPFLIKPNDKELLELVTSLMEDEACEYLTDLVHSTGKYDGTRWTGELTLEEISFLAGEIVAATGTENILITLAGRGSLLVNRAGATHFGAVPVEAKSTSLGGDTMVAVIAKCLSEKRMDVKRAVLYATCAGALTVKKDEYDVVEDWNQVTELTAQWRQELPVRRVHRDAGMIKKAARGLVDKIIIKARAAKQRGEKILVGIETSWIPMAQRPKIQRLLSSIVALEDNLKRAGLDNVFIRKEDGVELAGVMSTLLEEEEIPLANTIIFGDSDILLDDAFDVFVKPTEQAFFGYVVIPEGSHDVRYLWLVENLRRSVRLAFTPSGERSHIFNLPPTGPVGLDNLDDVYNAGADEIKRRA